ncbi:hypothetical protein RCL1_008652 [Eukaryota sp. TZLM3-RCL]
MPPVTRRASQSASQSDTTTSIQNSPPKKRQRKSKQVISSQPVIQDPIPSSQEAIPLYQEHEQEQEHVPNQEQLESESEQSQILEHILEQRPQEPEQEQQDQQDPPIPYRPKICPGSKSLYLDYTNPNKIQGQSDTYIYRPRPLLEDAPEIGQFRSREDFEQAYSKWKARQDSVRNFFRNINAPHHRINVCSGLFMAIPDKNKTIRIFGDLETFVDLLKHDTSVSIGDGDFSLKHDVSKISQHPVSEIISVLTSLITENP